MQYLEGLGECPGARLLATLLQEDTSLVQRLADPSQIELNTASRLLAILRQSDAQIEVRLARLIMPGADPVSAEITNRILDLIDAVTDGPRLMPVLMHMYRTAPKDIRARLATTISRHHRNRDWVDARLHDSDPRVRANMVQVFWGETASDAIGIFHNSLRNIDPRVRGNAALGLHAPGR